jgi:thiamine transporter
LRGWIEVHRPFEPDPDNTGGGKNMSNERRFLDIRVLTEIIVLAALSTVLYALTLPFLTLPYGGSVTAGCMIPIIWLSFRRGTKIGVTGGLVFGIVALVVDVIRLPYSPILNPLQVFLEYPLAFGSIGLAGLMKTRVTTSPIYPAIGVAIGTVGRFLCHFIAGIVFWILIYQIPLYDMVVLSAVYNGSFLLVEFVITAIIMHILVTKNLINIYL